MLLGAFGIVDGYDYTRETPFQDDLTLRALESGSMREHSEEIFKQLPEEVQQCMSAELSALASEMPTSDRTFVLVFHFAGGYLTPLASSKWPGLNVVAGTRDTPIFAGGGGGFVTPGRMVVFAWIPGK